jgi:hypothetical protein
MASNSLKTLLDFINSTSQSWSITARTITLITVLVWIPFITMAAVLAHAPLSGATATITGLSGAALFARRHGKNKSRGS